MQKIIKFFKNELARIILSLIFFIPAFILEWLGVKYVSLALFIAALLISGIPVFIAAVRGIIRCDWLDEKFLMSIASIGAFIVGEASEGAAVMIFFLVGEYFEHKAVARSRKSIQSLMSICPDTACVLIDGKEETVDADDVEIGSTVIIRSGERVAVDCVVISGRADVDNSALTGESIPLVAEVGYELKSGSVVLGGVVYAKALRPASESSSARIIELVENANDRKSKTESFITRFSRVYTPIVVALALLIAIVPPLFKLLSWNEAVYRSLIFLVTSCPCALVISVPMSFFGGIGAAASQGILYKGGNTFSALSRAQTFVFDKTGTLTDGEFAVSHLLPCGVSENELVFYSASAEYASNHPIAAAIKRACDSPTVPEEAVEIAGRGASACVNSSRIFVGNRELLSENGIDTSSIEYSHNSVFVAKDGVYIGAIGITDSIRAEAAETISQLRSLGANKTVLLSGDSYDNVNRVGQELNIDVIRSNLLPEEKFEHIKGISEKSGGVVYVGDGINDAPSIALADVGIAMGAIGSDSAIEAADVVIMSDNLRKIPTAIKIARKTIRISTENIISALFVKGLILILGALGFAGMWHAVFADVGVAVIAILNAMRTLKSNK